MLKYTVNAHDMRSVVEPLDVVNFSVDEDGIINEDKFVTDKVYTVTLYCRKPHGISEGGYVAITNNVATNTSYGDASSVHSFYREYRVVSVSPDGLNLTFNMPSRYAIGGMYARLVDSTEYVDYSASTERTVIPYTVEEIRRYIYFYFSEPHFFSDSLTDNIEFIIRSVNVNGNDMDVRVKGEYVSKNVIRVRVPKGAEISDTDESVIKKEGEIYYYSDHKNTNEGFTLVTQDMVDAVGDDYAVFDIPVTKDDGTTDVKTTLWEPYYEGDVCYCDNPEDGQQKAVTSPTDNDDYAYRDGVIYKRLNGADFVNLTDYEVDEQSGDVFIRDYSYVEVGGSWYLRSDELQYNEQKRLYPGDGKESDEWTLNNTWFGNKIDADYEVDLNGFRIDRDSIFMLGGYSVGNEMSFSAVRHMTGVDIPISHKFSPDIYLEGGIQKFVEDERAKAINPINEMEKNVYHPEVVTTNGEEDKQVVYQPVDKIVFNLHFRRRDENWNVVRGGFWNGVEWGVDENSGGNNNTDDNDPETAESVQKKHPLIQKDYFPNTNLINNSSDLLYALGFKNSDVRFQKNKLSKSFLRLSFYDSNDELKQNLLAYYTIFFDAGKSFRKYAQYFDTVELNKENRNDGKYKIIGEFSDGQYDISDSPAQYGIRTTRELIAGDSLSGEEVDERRLSSRFVVESRTTSVASSEGFYLYLWKDGFNPPMENGDCEADPIYMRVDFNHAGYGRTVPFTLPHQHIEGNTEGKTLSFAEIVGRWKDNDTAKGNDIKRFIDEAYIKIVRRFNKDDGRYYYHLDPDLYGYSGDGTNTLVYNLYEAKIYEGELDENGEIISPDEPGTDNNDEKNTEDGQ